MAYIEYKNVTFSYPDSKDRPALDSLDLQVEKGQFVVLFGPSGCGKSTLLRLLKKEIHPHGNLSGEVLLNGQNLLESPESRKIGYVFQEPENQVVAEEVLHELVFGLENLGLPLNEMRNRIAEMVNFMGAEGVLHRKTHTLSGGLKQQLNLSSILLMQPDILLLDEPTAQLDPVSTHEFLNMIIRLNEEFGLTVIMAEHRLEEGIAVADKIVMLEKGRVKTEGSPKQVLSEIWQTSYTRFIPPIPWYYLSFTENKRTASDDIPLTVKEGRRWLQSNYKEKEFQIRGRELTTVANENTVIQVSNLCFQYETRKKRETILNEVDLKLYSGELYALLGGNGSGKSTLLKLVCGIHYPQLGKITLMEKNMKRWSRNELVSIIGYLPQNPKLFFIQDTVEKELVETKKQWGMEWGEANSLIVALDVEHLLHKHPHDLSGGELQKVAITCLLLRKPKVLLLDEPTKGLDAISKQQLADILIRLKKDGVTIIMATHDIEFAAVHADRCGMMFEGKITSEAPPDTFFKGNFFYTTMIQRLFRGIDDQVATLEEAIRL